MRGSLPRGSRSRTPALIVLVALSVWVGACTADVASEADGGESTEDALDLGAAPSAESILPPDRGEPPSSLQTEDLVEGTGEAVAPGDVVTVEYRGWRWSDGGEFASSWGAGEPLRFELGAQEVIPGWEQGLLGRDQELAPIRVGGRRVLMIPPELAYGERGAGAAIGPDETLVFVVDLVVLGDETTASDDPTESEQPDG